MMKFMAFGKLEQNAIGSSWFQKDSKEDVCFKSFD